MKIRLLSLRYVVLLLVFGSLVGCRNAASSASRLDDVAVPLARGAGAIDDVVVRGATAGDDLARQGQALDDIVIRGATVGDDLARQGQSFDDVLARSSLDDILAGKATTADDVVIGGVRVSSYGDDVARMSRRADDEGSRLIERINGASAHTLDTAEESIWRDLVKEVACTYLEDKPLDEIVGDVQTHMDRNRQLVDSPEKSLLLISSAYSIANQYAEMSADDPLLYRVAVIAYCELS